MTKITADKILVAGWNSALNNVHSWIQEQRHEEQLTGTQEILLLELEEELNRMENLWRGKDVN